MPSRVGTYRGNNPNATSEWIDDTVLDAMLVTLGEELDLEAPPGKTKADIRRIMMDGAGKPVWAAQGDDFFYETIAVHGVNHSWYAAHYLALDGVFGAS